MNTNRRITRRRARALLEQPARAGDDTLARLMAAATASGTADAEREGAALAMFRMAAPANPPTARRPSMLKSLLANAAAAKVLASAAVAAAATGGVALAANGSLPLSFGSDNPAVSTPSASESALSSALPTDSSGTSALPTDSPLPSLSDVPSPSSTPSPSLCGLCNAYRSGVATSHGAALKNPAFSVLIQAAAGEDNVGDYCEKVLAARPGNHDLPGKPSDLPGNDDSDLPGKPSELPGKPSELPGKPSELPGKPSDNPGEGHGRGDRLPELPDDSVSFSASASASAGASVN
jgi:hypothetical protein